MALCSTEPHPSSSLWWHRITVNKEKRKLRLSIQQVQRDLYSFRKRFFLSEIKDSYVVHLKELMIYNKVTQNTFDETTPDFRSNDFLKWLETKSVLLNWSKLFLDELKKIAVKAISFEAFVSQTEAQLKKAFEKQILRYCRSFINEVTHQNVRIPRAYERNIQIWKDQIQSSQLAISTHLDQLETFSHHFFEYLNNYQQVINLMLGILNNIPPILQTMSRWLIEDDGYIRKLKNEIYSMAKRKAQINENIRAQQFCVTEARNNFQRRAFITQILWRDVKNYMEELRILGDQQNEIKNSQHQIEDEQELRKTELANAERQFANRKYNSSTFYDLLVGMIENRKLDIQKLGLSRNQGSIELSRILKAKLRCDVRLCLANNKYEASRQMQQEYDVVLQKELKALDELKVDLKEIENKMDALQKIKELKLQTRVVQTFLNIPQITGFENNGNVYFKDALNLVSNEIGTDWMCLYQILPFHPPRNIRSRIKDIEDIKRKHTDIGEMAFDSLEKWVNLNNGNSSISFLIGPLERLGKADIIALLKKHSFVNNQQ